MIVFTRVIHLVASNSKKYWFIKETVKKNIPVQSDIFPIINAPHIS